MLERANLLKVGDDYGCRAMVESFSREFLLMTACCVWPPSGCRNENIRRAAADSIDWSRFIRIVTRHRVIGLTYDGLTKAGIQIPAPIRQELSDRAAALVRDALVQAAEAARLQSLFDEESLPVLFVKGASLAILAYGNLGLRESKDLDLVVPSES